MPPACPVCSTRLVYRGGRPATFCSGACRSKAYRARRDAVPAELRERDRWVRCSSRKVPLTTAGRPASSTDSSTWTSYRAAAACPVGTGLGFVLDGDGLVCIDLDHALLHGRPTAAAQRVLDLLPAGCFVEVSRSGQGLHVFGWAQRFTGGRRFVHEGQAVEIYASGRFIAITGNVWRPGALLDLDPVIDDLLAGRETTRAR